MNTCGNGVTATMKLLVSFLLTLISITNTLAAEKAIWVEANGEAYMSEFDPPKEVMERAKRDAERKAIEEAVGTFVQAHTLVSNGQLAEDLSYAMVRGKTDKRVILREGWDDKDRNLYRVRIKALVRPVYPDRSEGIRLMLALSKSVLKEGEEVKLAYQANADCYLYLFIVAADGSVTLLFPNKIYQDNALKAGAAYTFPPLDSPIKLQAMFLPGWREASADEKVKAIVTRNREDLLAVGYQEGFFKVYDAKSTGMISDLVKRLNQLDPADWSESIATYRITK